MTGQGTLTVMFTDVVASTRLGAERGDHAALDIVERHGDDVRRCAETHGGRVVKGTGDGYLVVFPSARGGVLCALDIQETAGASEVMVRIGVHAGDAIMRGTDLYGTAVNACARITDRAEGGQVLVSDVVRQLAGSDPAICYRDRRPLKLRGLEGRWRLHEVERVPDPSSRAAPLRGRDAELAMLRDALERLRNGTGAAFVIEGEGGIGKTRLLREVERLATAMRMEVYSAASEELERAEPMRAVARALRPLADDLSSPIAKASPEEIADVLEARSLRTPVVLIMEDLHWAEPTTVAFVRSVAGRTQTSPVLLCASTRPVRGDPSLAQAVDRMIADGGGQILLDRLPDDAIAALVEDAIGDRPGPALRSELRRAGGSPFYALELVNALQEENQIVVSMGSADIISPTVPPSLRVTVLRRLATLPSASLETIRTCAMLGSSFTVADLATATGSSPLDLLRHLQAALSAGFIRDDGDRLAFRHDLVRATLYEDVPAALRRSIHRQIADAFIAGGRPSTAVATHMALGAELGDTVAVEWIMRAVEEMGITANVVTADLMTRAADLCAPDDPTRDRIQAQLVTYLAFTSRATEAEALAREVLRRQLDPVVATYAHHGLAHALLRQSRFAEASEQWAHVVASPAVPDEIKASTRADMSSVAFAAGDYVAASSLAHEAISAEGGPFAYGTCVGQATLSMLAAGEGRITDAIDFGLEAARWSDVLYERRSGIPAVRVATGGALVDGDRFDEAIDHLHLAYRRAEGAGISNATQFEQGLAMLRYTTGEWDDAIEHARRTVEVDEEFQVGSLYAFAVTARVLSHRGDVGGARRALDRATLMVSGGITPAGMDLVWLTLAEIEGDETSADLQRLESAWEAAGEVRFLRGTWRLLAPALVIAARNAGRTALVGEVVAATAEAARRASGVGSVDLVALRAEGIAAGDPERLVTAAAGLCETPRVVEAADAVRDAAFALADASDGRAASFFRDAQERYESLGAIADVERLRARMRDKGVNIGARGRRSRPSTGWEALTPSERRVVDLVVQGLTNAAIGDRLYVSRRTVQTHLRRVFDKLGVTSRAQVAAEAARRQSA